MTNDYQIPQSGAPYAAPTSTTAIISLVAGILGFTFLPIVGSIVAVITGMMARKEIRQSGGAVGGDGLATAGLVLGWIGVGLSVIGLCIGAFFLAIPMCLIPIGIFQNQLILPTLLFGLF